MAPNLERVKDAAVGRWPDILAQVGRVPADFLVVSKTQEGPCPCCGGSTRYRFDDQHGNGDWYCSHCGGKDRQGGGGNGFDLIMRTQNWTLAETVRAVAQHLGVADDWRSPTTFNPGRCDGFWQYTDEFVVVRRNRDTFNSKGKREKDVRPWRWNGQQWECKPPNGPLPLYNRDELRRRPDAPVLVVEGEKAADAAALLFPEQVVITWHGGTKRVAKTDWAPLQGRQVTLWPDADADGGGIRAMEKVAAIAPAAAFWLVTPPEGVPDTWDLADAAAAGWTPEQALDWLELHSQKLEPAAAAAETVADDAADDADEQEQPQEQQEPVTFEERWAALEAHADEVAQSNWPAMKAIASLSGRAGELGITRLTTGNLEGLLEDAQRRIRPTSAPIAPGGTFRVNPTPWAVAGVFRHGLNELVGQSGAGKSRLAADCMAAWLRGEPTWLNRELQGPPVEQRHALIVGTDQPLEDWALTLAPVGLCIRTTETDVQLHGRVTLYPLESGLRLDTDGLATIRRWADEHPGGMVLVDSLSATLPPGVDEDKSSAARPVHALQEALGNCWGILTHHTRKSAGKEGNLGVGAGRGSSAIDAAVSRVVGLGLIHKLEHGVLVAQESDPRRELLSTKRGGATLHLVISSSADGRWREIGDAAELKRQDQQDRIRQNLTDAQSEVMSVMELRPGEWLTTRQVAEGMGIDDAQWEEDRANKQVKAAGVRKNLNRLKDLGLIEGIRVGHETTYRFIPPEEPVDRGGI